jgi:predicted cupin superfamily sugar epimerase
VANAVGTHSAHAAGNPARLPESVYDTTHFRRLRALATRYTVDGVVIETLPVPALATAYGMQPHPEGGWYVRTWASDIAVDLVGDDGSVRTRPTATIILFLLPPGEFSAWHTVTSAETWIWNARAPIVLEIAGAGAQPGPSQQIVLGADIAAGQVLQAHIPAGVWQRTIPSTEAALASCVVSPGFDFADFSLDDRNPVG